MDENGGRWNGCDDQLDRRGLSLFSSCLEKAVSVHDVDALWVLVEKKRRESRESNRGADAKARAENMDSTRNMVL